MGSYYASIHIFTVCSLLPQNCNCHVNIIMFLVLISSSTGAGDQNISPSVSNLCRAEVSQQLQSSCSSFLRLVQERRENPGKGERVLLFGDKIWRHDLLCFERTWRSPLSFSVWVQCVRTKNTHITHWHYNSITIWDVTSPLRESNIIMFLLLRCSMTLIIDY